MLWRPLCRAGATYGDPYDITGGGYGATAHVSAAVKHRWGWIDAEHALTLTPESLNGTTRTVRLRAFDVADAPSSVVAGAEHLTVRLATRFMRSACDTRYAWCPVWGGSPWVGASDHFLYVSLRSAYSATKRGASLHLARYASDSWVDATALLPVRPADSEPGTVGVGETYVFDGASSTSISIRVNAIEEIEGEIEGAVLVIEVGYLDGAAQRVTYERSHAAALCARNLACGQRVSVQPTPYDVRPSRGDIAPLLVRVGEKHALSSRMRLCSNVSSGTVAHTVFAYDAFPHAPILFGAPAAIGAQAVLTDVCTGGVRLIQIGGTGVWWADAHSTPDA